MQITRVGKAWHAPEKLPEQVKAALTTLHKWIPFDSLTIERKIMEHETPIPELIENAIASMRAFWEGLTEAERIAVGHIRINIFNGGGVVVDRPPDTRGQHPGRMSI